MARYYKEVMCPICGKMMGKIITSKLGEGMPYAKRKRAKETYYAWRPGKLYLDYLKENWDEKKDWWGLLRKADGGKAAGFPIVGYLKDPSDDPELFEKLKEQFLRGIKWWLSRGWLKKEDLEDLIK